MGGVGSGGANGGPQYNPANVSGTGGAGQSGKGQPTRYISGMPYGQGQELMQQQSSAPMASAPTSTPSTPQVSNLPNVTQLTAPTERPEEPVTTGAALGPGAGPEALQLPSQEDNSEDRARLLSYLPAFEAAALSPNSSQAFRNYVRVLRAEFL
jgi:hypothetical protein